MEYDAELTGYHFYGNRVWGVIFNDKKKRFYDGETVTTSEIVEHDEVNKIIKTKNSTYKLVD